MHAAAICGAGASWRPKKSRSKKLSKTAQILISFRHRFLSVLAPFWRAKMAPKSIKNRSKLSFQAFLFPHRFLHRFFIEFSSQLRPTGSPKSVFFLEKNKFFFKNAFRRYHRLRLRFWCQLASMLASKIEDVTKFWPSKRPSKFHPFSHRFFIDFGSILASNMDPLWGPRRLQIRKNGSQNLAGCPFYVGS